MSRSEFVSLSYTINLSKQFKYNELLSIVKRTTTYCHIDHMFPRLYKRIKVQSTKEINPYLSYTGVF